MIIVCIEYLDITLTFLDFSLIREHSANCLYHQVSRGTLQKQKKERKQKWAFAFLRYITKSLGALCKNRRKTKVTIGFPSRGLSPLGLWHNNKRRLATHLVIIIIFIIIFIFIFILYLSYIYLFQLLNNNKRRLAAHLMVIIIFIFVFIFCLSYIYLTFILFYLYLHVDWWPIWWTSLFLQRAIFFVRNSSALFVWISKTASYIALG